MNKIKEEKSGFFKELNKLIKFQSGSILSTVLAKSGTYSYTLMCLAANTELDEHTSTKTGAVYVIEGKGTFRLFEKEIEMKPGTFIFMPKDSPHSLKAYEDTAILLCLTN